MMTSRAILILLLILVPTVPGYAAQTGPERWISEANDVLKADPVDAKAYYNRGTGFYEQGDHVNAAKDLSSSIALEPEASDSYFNRGLSYRRLHRNAEALVDFTKAVQLYPSQSVYHVERCNMLILMSDLDGAIAACSEAVRLSPEADSGYFLRGIAYMLRGDLNEGLADTIQTLQIWPGHPDAGRLMYETLLKRERLLGLPDLTRQEPNATYPSANRSDSLLGRVYSTERS